MNKFFDKINDCLEKIMIETLSTYGLDEDDINDDLITKQAKFLPYEFSYDDKKVLSIKSLVMDKDTWKMEVIKHKQSGEEVETIEV